jgi:superfamily II DNA or RNA helicase
VCDIPERTQLIAAQAKRLSDMNKFVLVLSHRRQHATDICSELKSLGVDSATYLGGDKSEPDCKVLCATYALASEGYDNPRLSGLVLATPSSDVVQAVGRVLRGGSGSAPIIVDIYDKYSLFMSQLAKRMTFYKKIGFAIQGDHVPEKKEEPEEIMFVED